MTAPLAGPAGVRAVWTRRGRLVLAAVLALCTVRLLATPDDWHFLDNIDLPIHETGHLVFAWGGDVLQALGGTLFQCLVPLVFMATFVRRGDASGAAASLWWAGQNGFNIARYVADARTQDLPLVGGGEHDWAFLLATWDLLDRDLALARFVRLVATVAMIAAVWWSWCAAERRTPDAA